MNRMCDSKHKFIGEDLLQFCRIVQVEAHGSTSVKPENLEKIMDAIDSIKFQETTPSAVIALTGSTEKAKFILMNFLFDTLEGMGEKRQQQLATTKGFDCSHSHRAGNSASIQRFLSIMEAGSDQDEATSEGIFLWPEPFFVKNHDEKQLAIWIMNVCRKEGTNSEELEEITAMLSSRVMTLECFPDNIRLRVLDPHRPITVSSDAAYPEPIYLEKICDSSTNEFRCNPLPDNTENLPEDNVMRNFSAAKGMNKALKSMINAIIEETVVATTSETDTNGLHTLTIGRMKEVITSAVGKSKDHRQQRKKCRLVMEQCLENASKQITERFPHFLETWMKTQFSMSKKQDILDLYTFLKKEVLGEFRNTVTTSLWKEFNELVDGRCKIELEEILKHGFKHVDMLTRLAEEQHQLLDYFLPQKLVEITKGVLKQVPNFSGEGKIFVQDVCRLAHERIADYYKEENKKILENEKNLFVQDATTHIGKVYHDEMEKYLGYAGYNPQTLGTLRQNLLEKFCGEVKSTFKSSWDSYTIELQEEIRNSIQKSKIQYNKKVEEMLKKYSYGLDVKTLGKYHTIIAGEVKKMLEMEIRSKIRQDDHLENHLKVLQDYIDKYWPTVVETNSKNFREQNERDEREYRKKKRLETLELEQHDKSSSLPPLVFHLQSSRISMAIMDAEGHAEILKNDLGEDQTPAFVVLTLPPESTFIYGSEALSYFNSLSFRDSNKDVNSWSIADFFLETDSTWTKKVFVNGQEHVITGEFLLSFLLGKLKHAAEDLKDGKFDTAVLAVPFWLSSTQRIKVKHAAKIAGFSESYLINEASAAAFNFVVGDIRSPQGKVLVISENLDRVDVFVYSFTKYDKTVKMIAHSGNYDGNQKALSTTKAISNNVKDTLLRNRLLFGQNTDHVDTDRAAAMKDVRYACKVVLDLAASEFHCAKIEPNDCLSFCENIEKWKEMLDTVVKDFGRNAVGIREENAVLHGAVVLSKNPTEMACSIRDKSAYDVLRKTLGGGIKIIGKLDNLPVKYRKQTTVLPQSHDKAFIYQCILGSQRPIGELYVEGVRYSQTVEATLEITNEAIVNYRCAMLVSTSAEYKCSVKDEQVHWKTPNLSKEQLNRFADLLKLLVTPPVLKEDPALSEARTNLLLKCQEMIEKIETGQYKIKSSLAKAMMLEKISVAQEYSGHANSSLEGIQNQMEGLQRLCDKYNKK